MTRAKPKPTIAIREPAKKQRAEIAALNEGAPAKPVPAQKAKAHQAPNTAAASKAAAVKPKRDVKALLSKTVAKKAVASDAVANEAASAKPKASKSATAKAAPGRPAADKHAPAKAAASKGSPDNASSAKAESGKRPVVLDTAAKIRPIEQAVGVSSDAVARRTGKSWAQWFALLDAAGAADLDHKGIVAVLAQRHGVGPWWQQMVTVAYEQARGKNGNSATDDGFQVDVSKVLELPLAKLFRFWAEPAERNKWLADDRFSIHKATASKSIRARWGRGASRIDVDFCEKGPSKSQVTVQHNRIETSDAAEQMKAYWAKKIRALEALTRP